MKEIISIIILLFFPILYKMVKDWQGVKHPATKETETLIFIMVINSTLMAFFTAAQHRVDILETYFLFTAKSILVSITGFQLFFTYLINWRLSYRFGFTPPRWLYIFNHLSSEAIPDRWPAYRALGWAGRLALWLTLFLLSVKWFI